MIEIEDTSASSQAPTPRLLNNRMLPLGVAL